MTELEKKIKDYADAYYRGEEIISDAEYDALLKQLKKENPNSEFLKKDILGDDLKGISKKYKLPITMGTLSKCNTEDEMQEWWNKHPHSNIVTESKIDGNGQCIEYKDGVFVRSYSRGNGVEGEDSTPNVSKVQDIPTKLKDNFSGYIRGEVVMNRSTFEKHFRDTGKKNPRNTVAGLLGRLDGVGCEHTHFIAYDVFDDNNNVDKSEIAKLNFLEKNGFVVPDFKINPSFEELLVWKNSITNDMEIPCDGIVIKQNHVDKNDLMRLTPQNNVAFKPNLQVAVTTVRKIRWQLRGSILSPLADVDPVELEGTTVVKASVANINKMKEMGIYEGAKVMISKHGMIIPHIDSVIEPKENAFEIPTVCPVCGEKLVIRSTGTFPECVNPDCSRKVGHKFARMFATLGVKNAGDAFIQNLEDNGVNFSQFFKMLKDGPKTVLNDFAGGINGEKVYTQMLKVLKELITPAKFLALFDYHGLAEKQFEKLGNKELKDILKLKASDMLTVKGIGSELAEKFEDFFAKDLEEILEISHYFEHIEVSNVVVDDSLKSVCFTGACPGYSRSELTKLASGKFNVVGAVNKELDLLVCADPNSGSSKLKKAAENGTKVISYDDFLDMLK